jgi:hypothetical protein
MPWNTDYTKFTPPMPRIELHGPLPEGVTERDPIAHEQRSREHIESWEWIKRFIVEAAEVPRYCPRKACKRNRACMSYKVACYDEAEDVLREIFFPRLRAALKENRRRRELAGEWPPSEVDSTTRNH